MSEETIPFNQVGSREPRTIEEVAKREGMSEAEWRALNLPSEKLEFRWRYANKSIPLYERRLRSLGACNVGPAVQAWVRSRLEWMRDNKLYEMPDGLIVLTVDPEGMVEAMQEPLGEAPKFTREMLDAGDVPGTLWVVRDGKAFPGEEPKAAADTFTRDLLATLGYEVVDEDVSLDNADVFAISDEFGIIPLERTQGPTAQRLIECFDKLWALKK